MCQLNVQLLDVTRIAIITYFVKALSLTQHANWMKYEKYLNGVAMHRA